MWCIRICVCYFGEQNTFVTEDLIVNYDWVYLYKLSIVIATTDGKTTVIFNFTAAFGWPGDFPETFVNVSNSPIVFFLLFSIWRWVELLFYCCWCCRYDLYCYYCLSLFREHLSSSILWRDASMTTDWLFILSFDEYKIMMTTMMMMMMIVTSLPLMRPLSLLTIVI